MSYNTKFMTIAEAQANVGTQVGGPFGTAIVNHATGELLVTGRNHV